MVIVDELKALDGPQRAAFTAALLGWALDAFDFFLLTFVLSANPHPTNCPPMNPTGEAVRIACGGLARSSFVTDVTASIPR